jgi:hypothetical protein
MRAKGRNELKQLENENRDVSHRFRNYKTLKAKYESLERHKSNMVLKQKQTEVENLLSEKELFLKDIQNLNYKQLNLIS